MKLHQLYQEQVLPITLEEAWEFLGNPQNLDKITPPDLEFHILTSPLAPMHEGQIIEYKIGILPGIKQYWVTEIKAVIPLKQFVDEQRTGPYKFWHHLHTLKPHPKGVMMTDTVHYALPFGLLGEIAHQVFVRKKLQTIFSHRKKILVDLFGTV